MASAESSQIPQQPPDHAGPIVAKARQLASEIAVANAASEPADGGREAHERGVAVAAIIAGLGLDDALIAAALLHPLLAAGLTDTATIAERAGTRVAELCGELMKLERHARLGRRRGGERDDEGARAESLRRMLLAMVSDVRLVLVRLAEQLHAMRAAKRAPAAGQRELATETREIYAPLANRLGIWQLKWELEDLAFRYLEPDTYRRIARQLNERRSERERDVEEVRAILARELESAGIGAEVAGRPKHIYSIWRKMKRKEAELGSIFDVRAVRILIGDVRDCYAALGVVHKLWPYLPGEFDDYIANPKDNLYQSLHTAVIGPRGEPLEVQIRTHEMHRHAELGVAAHWRYKEGGRSTAAFERKIELLRRLLEAGDETRGDELLEQFREEIREDRVYAISPRGDVVDLPAGATPLDFAYQVHTEVGHRCRGAKVNGRIVPLGYRLTNGDQVEIITGSQAAPSRDWLSPRAGFLASARNRAKVRAWFRRQDKDQNRRQGKELLERELARLNLRELDTGALAARLKLKDEDALLTALGAGDLTLGSVVNAAQQLEAPPERPRRRVRRRRGARAAGERGGAIRVRGVGDLMSQLARCCRPVPPEPIAGYITQGRGVSIHRADCRNFLRLAERHHQRVIEVEWGGDEAARYPVEIRLEALDRQGLLRDVSTVLSDEQIAILESNARVERESARATVLLSVEVPDLETLSRALGRLERLPNVLAARRAA